MENSRQAMFFSRRSLVQGVYQNLSKFNPSLAREVLFQQDASQVRMDCDEEFLTFSIQKVLENWDDLKKAVEFYKREDHEFSRCAQAVLIAAFTELSSKRAPINIVIDDYISTSKMFCEAETKAINKILDSFVKHCACDIKNLQKSPEYVVENGIIKEIKSQVEVVATDYEVEVIENEIPCQVIEKSNAIEMEAKARFNQALADMKSRRRCDGDSNKLTLRDCIKKQSESTKEECEALGIKLA